MADLDIAQDLGTSANQHAAANLGMPVACFLAGATQGDILQDRDIILDHGCCTHDNTRRVIEEDALAKARRRIDVDLENDG